MTRTAKRSAALGCVPFATARALFAVGCTLFVVGGAVLALGCTPRLILTSIAPDRLRRLELTEEGASIRARTSGGDVGVVIEAIAPETLRWTSRGPVFAARIGGAWSIVDAGVVGPPFLEVAEVHVAGEHVAYLGATESGWQVVVDGVPSAHRAAVGAGTLVLDEARGRAAVVVQDGDGARVLDVVGTETRLGAPHESIEDLTLGSRGTVLAYVGRNRGLETLVVEEVSVALAEDVLEIAIAADVPRVAALVADGDSCTLVHDGARLGEEFPALAFLRISDDGEHVAALAPASDDGSISVLRDGAVVAVHRRVEGDALAFVPGTSRLVWLAEDVQGPRFVIDGVASERFESISGPVLAHGHHGYLGVRGGSTLVVVDGETVGTEVWAGTLRIADRSGEWAYAARDAAGARAIVTRRGRWPMPRFFVDTLVLSDDGRHVAALVPDGGERRLRVFVDGEPGTEISPDELGASVVMLGDGLQATDAVREIVRGELRRAFVSD